MKNVLVFPCGSEIGLEIQRAMKNSIHFKLFGGSSVRDHGRFTYKNYVDGIPFFYENNFIEEINNVVSKYNIEYIVPAHDSVMLKLAENSHLINAEIVTSEVETCRICRSKINTYKTFKGIIPVPIIYNFNSAKDFPLFLKPDIGQGSKGAKKIENEEELTFYCKKNDLVLTEYLPGNEYTVDCFTNKKGKLLFSEGRQRSRIVNGISVNSKRTINEKFKEYAERINNKMRLRGAWFFQVKERENGEMVLMEIAPRIAGTMSLYRVLGVNFIQLSLFDRMGFNVNILFNDLYIEVDRALESRYLLDYTYENVYIDLDDTIIVDGKVNTEIIKYLYQCVNEEKKIILLTKHKNDVIKTLRNHLLSEMLFNQIIVIDQGENKYEKIHPNKSIFIDDSFAERKEVFDRLKIPALGCDSIEMLLK